MSIKLLRSNSVNSEREHAISHHQKVKKDQIEHQCENEQKRNGNLYFMSGKSDKTILEARG